MSSIPSDRVTEAAEEVRSEMWKGLKDYVPAQDLKLSEVRFIVDWAASCAARQIAKISLEIDSQNSAKKAP